MTVPVLTSKNIQQLKPACQFGHMHYPNISLFICYEKKMNNRDLKFIQAGFATKD